MSAAENTEEAGWKPRANPWLIAVVVTLGAFMEVLDTTIVNVALPHIAGTMSVSYDNATWALTSYLVANGIVLTVSGWFGRVLGRKRYFLICISMFALFSLLCGLSTNMAELIVFRLLQGFFGGGLQPTQQAIILDNFPPEQRNRAFALTAIATVVAPVLGPTLGGLITDNISWPWIFFINLPFAIIAFFGVTRLVDDPPWARASGLHGIDAIGLGLITLGLGSLQIMMDRGEDADWFSSPFICTMAIMAALGILGAIGWLLYEPEPVVNIRVFKDFNFVISSLLMIAMALVLYASAVVIPQLSQQVLGYTATLAGFVLTPGALLLTCLIPVVSRVQLVVQTKYLIAIGFTLLGLSMLYSHDVDLQASFGALVLIRTSQTAGLAFLFAPLSAIAFTHIRREDNGDAAALFTMLRNVSGSIGISLATATIVNRTQVRTAYLAEHLTPLNQGYQYAIRQYESGLAAVGAPASQTAVSVIYKNLQSQASILAYMDVFSYCAIMAFAAAPLAFLLASQKSKDTGAA